MPPGDSPLLEIAPIREMLRLYCSALSEGDVDIRDARRLAEKDIGWTRGDVATSDGSAIFLPPCIDRFESRAENFEFLKVMVTQQAGHLQFGTFKFDFARASTSFHDWRPRLESRLEPVEKGGEASALTEFSRFFGLFPNARLGFDIFALVESTRIEACVMRFYRGLAPSYHLLRKRALAMRQEMVYLPAREALLEFMARVSLGERGEIRIPSDHAGLAARIGALLQTGCAPTATVEDAAEASLRMYALLSVVANERLHRDQFSTLDAEALLFQDEDPAIAGDAAERANTSFSPAAAARGRDAYDPPQGIDYRGELNPELAQLFTRARPSAAEQRKALTSEELAQMLRHKRPESGNDMRGEDEDSQIARAVQNLIRELEHAQPGTTKAAARPWLHAEEESGALSANQPNAFIYDEWDVYSQQYRTGWCRVLEKVMACGDNNFYRDTLRRHAPLWRQIRREFEQVAPEVYHREKRLADGTEHDLDAAIEALTDLRIGIAPSEKIFWRHHKRERDVAVVFLLDMSGSTGETIATASGGANGRTGEGSSDQPVRPSWRIIDVEKEAIVMMTNALETIGDRYGVYGFSGHGRENVEFFVVKEFEEEMSLDVAARFGRIEPLHATRMGPAIRHATMKLSQQQTKSKYLFLISDGRPQDRGYSQESNEKAYAIQDTRMALVEGRRQGIHAFCLTVDKEGNDYLRTMVDDFSYEVLAEVTMLPHRLPQLYKKLTA